ncbi:MAG: hypothetical protein IKJ27_01160 [Clostridia bacterium]|nr:hypothetical protein [Clostridia bacterium]
MEINKHICFIADDVPELIDYLNANGIFYEPVSIGSTVLDILESSPHWNYISKIVEHKKLPYSSETFFTKEELNNAEWLRIRSKWRFGYPQPELTFIKDGTTYCYDNKCSECGSGEVQREPFKIKKVPKWGKRFFGELNWIGDELFVNDKAKEALLENGIKGISFMDVLSKNGKEVLPDIHQLVIPNTLDGGLMAGCRAISESQLCSKCRVTKYLSSGIGMLHFKKEVFENQPDIVKTGEIFGSMHYAAKLIIVRQKVYKMIVDNKMERGLVFSPIVLED